MKQLKRILFPTDFSRCANQAMSRAYNLARSFGSELHMLHALVLHEGDPYSPMHHVQDIEKVADRLKDTAFEQMDAIVESYACEDIKVVKAQERGISAAPAILNYVQDHDIDLVVMGTHGRRGLGHLFLGSVAEEVVRHAPCPVLTIREQKEPQKIEKIEKILVPVDFSEHAELALTNAKELATRYGAKLQILHVIEQTVHPAFYASGSTSIFELIPDIRTKSEEAMHGMLQRVGGPNVPSEFHVIEGRASSDIVKFAGKAGSDLIVISTHGLTGIEHLLLGSVTEKVVRMAPCPVLTLTAFGKSLTS